MVLGIGESHQGPEEKNLDSPVRPCTTSETPPRTEILNPLLAHVHENLPALSLGSLVNQLYLKSDMLGFKVTLLHPLLLFPPVGKEVNIGGSILWLTATIFSPPVRPGFQKTTVEWKRQKPGLVGIRMTGREKGQWALGQSPPTCVTCPTLQPPHSEEGTSLFSGT